MYLKFGLASVLTLIFSSMLFAQNYGNWYLTDSLNEKRSNHAGIVLSNGNILVTGTNSSPHPLATCEVFDVNNHKWNYITSMNKGRMYHTLEKLDNGRVMAIGGFAEGSCEILSDDLSKWTFTDSLKKKRLWGQTTTVLGDGRILLAGGYSDYPVNDSSVALNECEIYDPITQKWEVAGELNMGRYFHAATLLMDGRVLVTGGSGQGNYSCEIFDPVNNKWKVVASMNQGRVSHSATLLPDGRVIVLGGTSEKVEIYNPVKDTCEVAGNTEFVYGSNIAYPIDNYSYLVAVQEEQSEPGWEIISLTDFKSLFHKRFDTAEYGQVLLKINEKNLLLAGGHDIDFRGTPKILTIRRCRIFDFNLSDVKGTNISRNYSGVSQLKCYPNPFNNQINIAVKINNTSMTSIKVYNALGSEISEVYNGELTEGSHLFKYDMNNFSSGVYFIQMISVKQKKEIKIIHLK